MNSPKNANFFMFIIMIFTILIGNILLINLFSEIMPFMLKPENFWLLQSTYSIICFILPIILYVVFKKINIKEAIPLKPLSLKNIFITIIMSFSIMPLANLISAITDLFFKNEIVDSLYDSSNLGLFKSLFSTAIIPAITEELAFRGVILSGYKKNSLLTGALISSFYFGIMHLTFTQLFFAIILGIFFTYLVRVTKSLYSSMLMHFLINSTSVISLYSLAKKSPDTVLNELSKQTTAIDILPFFVMFLLSLPFLLISIFLFIKVNKEEIKELKNENISIKNSQDKPKIFTAFFFVNIIIFILFMAFKSIIRQ
ncbi:CPBP family intramembrane glutamic endopeptidase [[Clostridium] colinum]|uniref:CPBP family intramembrane glutamic endopeptidase n=1 Tax=[Clostridium] colinum TaxID=36835 RepID=UPI0020240F2D|nr:type II CAAX endopeptidase family protein [[Clostridium] colinum]